MRRGSAKRPFIFLIHLAPEEAVTPQPATVAPIGPCMARSAPPLLRRVRAGNPGRHVEAHGVHRGPRRSLTSAGGLALTQEPPGSTLRPLPGGRTDRRRREAGRAAPRSGAGHLLLGRKSAMPRQSHHGTPATALCEKLTAAASTRAGPGHCLGTRRRAVTAQAHAAVRRPHGLRKTARTGRRTVATRGDTTRSLLGEQRAAHGKEPDPQEPAGEEGRGDQHTAGRRRHPSRAGAERRRLQQRMALAISLGPCEVPDDEVETCDGVRVWERPC